MVGLYISAYASDAATANRKPSSVTTIERRLSSQSWNYARHGGEKLDRKDRAIAMVMVGIRNTHAAPPRQKKAGLPEDLLAMLDTLERGALRGLCDRATLLIGFGGGPRRSEIVGLDLGRDQTEDGRGWIEILDKGLLVTLRGKTGWREVEARRKVARLVKKAALAAGIRGDLGEIEWAEKFRAIRCVPASAEVDERYVQKQLGHASAEMMTRKYQRRRDRFRINLTKASGL